MSEEFDYNRYEGIILKMLDVMWRDPDELEIGEDISDLPEVKIIFDGHGDLEDEDENGEYRYTERGDKNLESYAIFLHKGVLTDEEFVFPEHEQTPWALIHRPKEEICIYAWYDVENEEWSINGIYETSECDVSEEEVMQILEFIDNRYFSRKFIPDTDIDPDQPDGNAAWPFK
jgi:hypothetical protein